MELGEERKSKLCQEQVLKNSLHKEWEDVNFYNLNFVNSTEDQMLTLQGGMAKPLPLYLDQHPILEMQYIKCQIIWTNIEKKSGKTQLYEFRWVQYEWATHSTADLFQKFNSITEFPIWCKRTSPLQRWKGMLSSPKWPWRF